MPEVIKKAFLLALLPVIELVFLRVYLHSFLNLRIGFPGMTDYDFFIPGPVAFLLLVYSLESGKSSRLKIQKNILLTNLLLLALCVLNGHLYSSVSSFSSFLWRSSFFVLLIGLVASGFGSFISFSYYFKNPNRISIIPATLIAFIFPIYMLLFQKVWGSFSFFTSTGVEKLTRLLFGNAVEISLSPSRYLILDHELLKVRIGQGCIGGDGVLLFTFVTLMLMILFRKSVTRFQWFLVFLSGLVVMYLVNLVRIIFLFVLGIALMKTFESERAMLIFKLTAHTHLGWILYLTSIASYFSLLFSFSKLQIPFSLTRVASD